MSHPNNYAPILSFRRSDGVVVVVNGMECAINHLLIVFSLLMSPFLLLSLAGISNSFRTSSLFPKPSLLVPLGCWFGLGEGEHLESSLSLSFLGLERIMRL